MNKFLVFIFLITTLLNADEATDIIEKLEKNIRGESVYVKFNMKIVSKRHERNMKMESYSIGSDKSFVKILYPPKDRGITFLNLDNQMWQYVPRIERTIKIPPSMMLQNWMGSNFTNDDMVKQSSMLEDYDPTILKKDGTLVTMQLIPKEDAAVVWGKIISHIDTTTYTSKKDVFYDEDGEEVRVFLYEDVKKIGKYYIPTYWKIQPSDKKTSYTEIILEDVDYDKEISDKYFKKSALKRYSR